MRKFILVFFDDILIYSKGWQDHLQHLEMVFNLMMEHKLLVMKCKCSFGVSKIEYLGRFIVANGVSTDPQKITAVEQWPKPENIKQLRGFLGLGGYYRRFIKNYGLISKPLTDLLKKDGFYWNTEADQAFIKLKGALTSHPVLALPDFNKVFVVETDASGKGVGVVLMQEGHPISFLSNNRWLCQCTIASYLLW